MAQDIREWLSDLGLDEYADAFVENEVGPSLLAELTNDDLKDLGVAKLGHRKAMLASIRKLGAPAETTSYEAAGKDISARGTVHAERRQLTVLFCDLAGSTELSRRLDPEELRDVMCRYQDAVAGAVSRYGGYVAKYLGDGVLAYFGWPHAHEDQAERAVRAGLDCVIRVGDVRIANDRPLEARIGIATGQVVVGDLVGESGREFDAVSGETPNLAARLQNLADRGQVIIDGMTNEQIGRTFAAHDLGDKKLKGFDHSIRAWSVGSEIVADSRFEAMRGASRAAMIGRDTELRLLLDRWELACGGEGQAVAISGEAGIGKSRLLQSLHDSVRRQEHLHVRYQCSPYHSNSALYPSVRQLERAARFARDDTGEAKIEKLETLLGQADRGLIADAPLFAHLLSLPGDGRYGPLSLPPQQIKERLLEALLNQLLGLAAQHPVLFLFEDTHWIDPTSQELLQRTLGRIQDARVLLVVTHRPEWRAPATSHSHITTLQLNRLAKAHGEAIVHAVSGKDLAPELVSRIVERTDGIPLFIEELTKSLLEAGGAADEVDIPSTLQASLTERLDRLGSAKEIAQIGAVIGREFPLALLAAVAVRPTDELSKAIEDLVRSELIFRRGREAEQVLIFKHALVRDTAYESLLHALRRNWHHRIAEAMETGFPGALETEPEVIAQHWLEAGEPARAIPLLLRAGHSASTRSATSEAAAHFERALQFFDRLPASERTDVQELEILAPLGPALMNLKGFAHAEVGEVLRRANNVATRSNSGDHLFLIAWNLWLHHHIRGDLAGAVKWSDEVVRLAEAAGDDEHLLQAHHAVWTTDMPRGRFSEARSRCEAGVAIYDPERHHQSTYSYGGHDAGVCGHGQLGVAMSLQGDLDQALWHGREAVALAERLGHGPSLTVAWGWLGLQYTVRREPATPKTQAQAEAFLEEITRGLTAVEKFGPPHFRPNCQCCLGWAKVAMGRVDEGLHDVQSSIDFYRKAGATLRLPIFLFVLAEVCLAVGEPERSIAAADEGLEIVEHHGDRTLWADLFRVKAAGVLQRWDDDGDAAENLFLRAIETAREQGARLLELRAATGLAQLMQLQGRNTGARDLLTPILCGFSEGIESQDLTKAQAVLTSVS